MVWKCSKCAYRTQSHSAMQKHFYSKHYKSKAKSSKNKGKDKKVHVYRPTLPKRR